MGARKQKVNDAKGGSYLLVAWPQAHRPRTLGAGRPHKYHLDGSPQVSIFERPGNEMNSETVCCAVAVLTSLIVNIVDV